jgi:hypothetical protein
MPWLCPCGASNGDDRQSCRACGYQLLQPVPHQPPAPPTSQVTINYPPKQSIVNDLRAMGGTGAAKLSFGATFGVAAGWTIGRFFGCLVIVLVIVTGLFLIGALVQFFASDTPKLKPTGATTEAPIRSPVNSDVQAPPQSDKEFDTQAGETSAQPLQPRSFDPSLPREPATASSAGTASPTSGVLCDGAIQVPQYGQLVFENLPGDRLKFTFDHGAWQPIIRRQPNGKQTLVMRSLKTGIQTKCEMRWEIVP